jgi:hypothetical protein
MSIPHSSPRRGLGRSSTAVLLLASVGFAGLPQPADAAVPLAMLSDDTQSQQTSANMAAVFIKAMEKMLDEYPNGRKTPRENAYSAIVAMWIGFCGAGASNMVGLSGAGAGIGGALGGIGGAMVGSAFTPIGSSVGATAGAGVGTTAGSGAGMFLGGQLTFAEAVALGIITLHLVDHIESRYGYSAAASKPTSEASTMLGYVPSRPIAAWASSKSGSAGKYQSMFVHLVEIGFSDKLLQLADRWDSTPGLTAGAKAKLRSDYAWMRAPLQRLADIKRTHKVAPSARPAAPLPGWLEAVSRIMAADSETVRDAWLTALGVGEGDLSIGNGKLVLKTSNELRRAGAPNTYEVDLPKLEASVSGPQTPAGKTSLSASLTLQGDFHVGKAKLVESGGDAGKVKVDFDMGRDSTVAKGNLSCSGPGCPRGSIGVDLRTDRALSGQVLFRFSGTKLVVDKVTLGALSLKTNFTGVPGPLQPIANDIGGKIRDKFASALPTSKIDSLFGNAGSFAGRAFEKAIQAHPGDFGLYSISGADAFSLGGGKLRVSIRGQRIAWPVPPSNPDALAVLRAEAGKPKAKPLAKPMSKAPTALPAAKATKLPIKG